MSSLLTCRHGDWQHAGIGSAGGERSGEGEGGHVEASPPSERKEVQQPNTTGSVLRWHRQKTLRPPSVGPQRWDHGAPVTVKLSSFWWIMRFSSSRQKKSLNQTRIVTERLKTEIFSIKQDNLVFLQNDSTLSFCCLLERVWENNPNSSSSYSQFQTHLSSVSKCQHSFWVNCVQVITSLQLW